MVTKGSQEWIQILVEQKTLKRIYSTFGDHSDAFSFEKILAENIIAKN